MEYCAHCMSPLKGDAQLCGACGEKTGLTVPAHHLRPGTLLNKRYLVGKALGEGGFGITYIGRDLNLDMKVAIKEFYPNGYVNRSSTASSDVSESMTPDRKDFYDKGRERFLNEARILAKFSGEAGIVDVRDFFEENNTAYIIMEYLAGQDLKEYIKKKGRLSGEETVQLLMPVMQALRKIHKQGLIHRDISPDNIRLVEQGAKLLDFGAARNVSAVANKSLSVMLKPGYAPEEQYRSKGNQGPWTDVYALCATMYKCITGVTPDDATQRVFDDELKSPRALGIPMNETIEKALMKGLNVLQKDRYQSIDELLDGLNGLDKADAVAFSEEKTVYSPSLHSEEEGVTSYIAGSDNQPQTAPKAEPKTENIPIQPTRPEKQAKPKAKRKTGPIILIALIAVAVAVGAIIALPLLSGGGDEGTKTAPVQMSDDPMDFTVGLEGTVYKLPCSYDALTAEGWSLSDENALVGAGDYLLCEMNRNGKAITVYVYNTTEDDIAITECTVGGFEVKRDSGVAFELSGGISLSSTLDGIVKAYGEPDYSFEKDTLVGYRKTRGENAGFRSIEFCFDGEALSNGYIRVLNFED